MTSEKYKILKRIHTSFTPLNPARHSDFYKKKRTINRNKRLINELICAGLLKEALGSDVLALTDKGIAELEKDIERREDIQRLLVQFWISAAISVLALVVSIIVLLLQAGILMPAIP